MPYYEPINIDLTFKIFIFLVFVVLFIIVRNIFSETTSKDTTTINFIFYFKMPHDSNTEDEETCDKDKNISDT